MIDFSWKWSFNSESVAFTHRYVRNIKHFFGTLIDKITRELTDNSIIISVHHTLLSRIQIVSG